MTGVSRNTVIKYVTLLQRLSLTAEDLRQRKAEQLKQVFSLEPPQEAGPRLAILHVFIEHNNKRMK